MYMEKSILRSKVNFYISMCFVAAFGLFAVQTVLNSTHQDNPIANTIAATAGYNQALTQDLNQ